MTVKVQEQHQFQAMHSDLKAITVKCMNLTAKLEVCQW